MELTDKLYLSRESLAPRGHLPIYLLHFVRGHLCSTGMTKWQIMAVPWLLSSSTYPFLCPFFIISIVNRIVNDPSETPLEFLREESLSLLLQMKNVWKIRVNERSCNIAEALRIIP